MRTAKLIAVIWEVEDAYPAGDNVWTLVSSDLTLLITVHTLFTSVSFSSKN
jgi:hypothetical protein